MTIRRGIGIVVLSLLLCLLFTGINAHLGLQKIKTSLETVIFEEVPQSTAAFEIEINIKEVGYSTLSYVINRDPNHIERIREDDARVREFISKYGELAKTEAEKELLFTEELTTIYNQFSDLAWQVVETEHLITEKEAELSTSIETLRDLLSKNLREVANKNVGTSDEQLQVGMAMESHLNSMLQDVLKYSMLPQEQLLESIEINKNSFETQIREYRRLAADSNERKQVVMLHTLFSQSTSIMGDIVAFRADRDAQLTDFAKTSQLLEKLIDTELQTHSLAEFRAAQSSALDVLKRAQTTMMMLYAFAIMISFFGLLLISIKVTTPIKTFLAATKKVAQGDFQTPLSVDSGDEFGLLAKHFNEMSTRLEEAQSVEKQLRTNLEKRVDERTTELVLANEELKNEISRRSAAEAHKEKAEEQLRQVQRVDAIGRLAGGVAHDFNNMLQVIMGYVEIVQVGRSEDEKLLQDLSEIHKAAEKAAGLTRQLLTFGRLQPMEMKDIDLNDLIKPTLKMVRRLIGEHIEIEFLPEENLQAVHADHSQLDQVIMNLAINARDAMEDGGGKLSIETKNHIVMENEIMGSVPFLAPGDYVTLTISDTGYGMSSETKERVFEPFYTTKKVGKGSGMGMAVVYGIIKSHNGTIAIDSEEGEGTSIRIILPAAVAEAEEFQTERVISPTLGGTETILLAEDEEATRKLVKRTLEGIGYTVLIAQNGEEAITLFNDNIDKIDLLVFDVIMPKTGGLEAYEQIKNVRPDIPILFCSGYSANERQLETVREEGAELLQKPYARDVLLCKVREILDRLPHSS